MNVLKKIDDILALPWVLWAISLSIAIFMWFYVMDTGKQVTVRRKFVCSVEYFNVDPQYRLKNMVKTVEVEIDAPEKIIEGLTEEAIRCEVFSSGRPWELVKVELPPNVTLVRVEPPRVYVERVPFGSRVFPVELTLPQDIPSGRYLENVEIVPREINVTGIERDIAKIGSVSVVPTVRELESGKELRLPVQLVQSEPFEDEVVLDPSQVKVNATLVTGFPRKKAAVNVRLSGKPFSDYAVRSVTTDPAEVMLQGPKNKLDTIQAVDTEIVDISNLSADQRIVVPLQLPKDKEVSILETTSVRLSIELAPIVAQKELVNRPIVVEGLDAGNGKGKKWILSPAVANVTVEASPSYMETLDSGAFELKVFIDVSNIFLQSTTLPVRAVSSTQNIRVVKVNPSTVTVNTVEE